MINVTFCINVRILIITKKYIMKCINSKKNDNSGTGNVGCITITYQKLVDTFGKETFGFSGDNKCSAEWVLLFEDGTIATIYDYKTNKRYYGVNGVHKTENTDWHIGGKTEKALELVKAELSLV